MGHWTLDDISWDTFDRSKISPELVSVVKAASMVEHNGRDYARYLEEVFKDDPEFIKVAWSWAEEEVQHGKALRKWAELADPDFDFEKCFKTFTDGYKLPVNVKKSVRGTRSGELIARCIVETGTSSYYTAIKEYSDEPVLKEIAGKIAADEFRHYQLFYTHLQRYLEKENIGFVRRLGVALGRIAESEDDELSYALYAAQDSHSGKRYNRKVYANQYLSNVRKLYRRPHIDRMTAMVFKAVGLKPHTMLNRVFSHVAWYTFQKRRV